MGLNRSQSASIRSRSQTWFNFVRDLLKMGMFNCIDYEGSVFNNSEASDWYYIFNHWVTG